MIINCSQIDVTLSCQYYEKSCGHRLIVSKTTLWKISYIHKWSLTWAVSKRVAGVDETSEAVREHHTLTTLTKKKRHHWVEHHESQDSQPPLYTPTDQLNLHYLLIQQLFTKQILFQFIQILSQTQWTFFQIFRRNPTVLLRLTTLKKRMIKTKTNHQTLSSWPVPRC